MPIRLAFLVLLAGVILAGCGAPSSELSEDKDAKLRNDITRDLTPEERAQLGQGDPPDASMKGQ